MRGLPLEEKPPTLGQFCLPIPPPANVLRNLPLELPSQATAEAPVDKKQERQSTLIADLGH